MRDVWRSGRYARHVVDISFLKRERVYPKSSIPSAEFLPLSNKGDQDRIAHGKVIHTFFQNSV